MKNEKLLAIFKKEWGAYVDPDYEVYPDSRVIKQYLSMVGALNRVDIKLSRNDALQTMRLDVLDKDSTLASIQDISAEELFSPRDTLIVLERYIQRALDSFRRTKKTPRQLTAMEIMMQQREIEREEFYRQLEKGR